MMVITAILKIYQIQITKEIHSVKSLFVRLHLPVEVRILIIDQRCTSESPCGSNGDCYQVNCYFKYCIHLPVLNIVFVIVVIMALTAKLSYRM